MSMSRSNGIAIRLAFRAGETKLTTRIVSADWIVWRCETIQILASLMPLLFYFFSRSRYHRLQLGCCSLKDSSCCLGPPPIYLHARANPSEKAVGFCCANLCDMKLLISFEWQFQPVYFILSSGRVLSSLLKWPT